MPSPKFSGRPAFKGRILCEICFASSFMKNLSRAKFSKISNIENFVGFAKRWKLFNHDDLPNSNDKYAHKALDPKEYF